MATIYVTISAHGYGHGALTTPVLDALYAAVPGLRIVIGTGLPEAWLRQRLRAPFDYRRTEGDIGLIMHSPTEVDRPASAAAYRRFHVDLETKIAAECAVMADIRPDVVLANVGYVSIAAARRLGLPVVALAPFDWSDILEAYLKHKSGLPEIIGEMRFIYSGVAAFLRPEPSLPPKFPVCRSIGPIARAGAARGAELRRKCGCGNDERIGLIAFGGIQGGDVIDRWIEAPGWRWIVGENFATDRPDMVPFQSLDMSFTDLLASADVVVAKPGYGTYTEAACSGARVLTMARPDWPEWPYLSSYLTAHCASVILEPEIFWSQNYLRELECLADMPRKSRARAEGAGEAAAILKSYLT